ncbi:MAG: TolC family protein [Bacteroidetes bacterium]|nr:TolC family protein [Bacteroidota bacterium]
MPKYKFAFYIACIFLFSFTRASAQEQLTLEQALEIVLKNNYSVQIAGNRAQIADNNASAGNAGMLPRFSLGASANLASNDTKQKFSNGTDVDKAGAASTNITAGLNFSWTLFDGMKMFAAYDKLQALSEAEKLNLKMQIENTAAQVITSYYALVKQKQLIIAAENGLQLYEERAKIAEKKQEVGTGAKSDYLQAQVDKNEQLSNYLTLKNAMAQLKANFNTLLSRSTETDFIVNDSIPLNYSPAYEDLKNTVQKNNNRILFGQKNIQISKLAIKESSSSYFPTLTLNSNYNYGRSQNQVGFILLNQNLGFTAGLTAAWALFDGFNTDRQSENSRIDLLNSQLALEETRLGVETSLLTAYTNFKNAIELLNLEEDNLNLAEENVLMAMERFRLGNFTTIQLKTAQQSLDNARTRLVNARFAAKSQEIELRRLSGDLVK